MYVGVESSEFGRAVSTVADMDERYEEIESPVSEIVVWFRRL